MKVGEVRACFFSREDGGKSGTLIAADGCIGWIPVRTPGDGESLIQRINGVVVTWIVATIGLSVDPPGVRFPLNAYTFSFFRGSST